MYCSLARAAKAEEEEEEEEEMENPWMQSAIST